MAERFQEEGARRLHVVDLDAALGQGDNREVGAATSATRWRSRCRWAAGCARSRTSARSWRPGASRAILGTAAAADPTFVSRAVEEYAERVVVAVDVRGGRVMVHGWTEEGPALEEAVAALDDAGTPRYLVTSIARDGTLDGPDIRLYTQVLKLTKTPVIASGGVRDADDIWALRDLGCEAAVTGKALYERTLKLSQVIRG